MTRSLLFAAHVRCGIVLRLLRVSADFLLWAVDGVSRTSLGDRLVLSMATGNGRPEANRPGGDLPVRVHVPWSSRGGGGRAGAGVTLDSAGLYDLDTRYIPDVLGLRARQLEAQVMKVMSRKDNRCVLVLTPDENVGHQGFHDVLLHDMTDADALCVAVSDLSALCQDWPAVVISGMTRHQLELEQMGYDCKKRYRGIQIGLCTFCGKVIRLDLARHVANYHLELAQLWRCPVSWCTIWNGMPHDCIYHIRLAHAVPATVKAANLGRWFPPWTVSLDKWREALKSSVSGVSMDVLLFNQSGVPLVHRYRVFSRAETYVSFRGNYMIKLDAVDVTTPLPRSRLYGRQTSLLPINLQLPKFDDKDFIPDML